MLYKDEATNLARAINRYWPRLSKMDDERREEALATLCENILRFGPTGCTTPAMLNPPEVYALIKKGIRRPKRPEPTARKTPSREPKKALET